MSNLNALPVGTELAGDFRIERVLGAGGFGITYLAEEIPLARRVTIKEYFPPDFAAREGTDRVQPRSKSCAEDYRWGLDRFLDEAKTLARFDHPNIVRVHRYFRANRTGYIVTNFEEGRSFKDWLKGLRRAPRQPELDRIVEPLLDALAVVHAADYLHRDIAPDNIIIRSDGTPVLIDFGSARGDMAQHSKTVSALVKPGYSPYEQYGTSGRQQGPWTDIYSLGATLYQAVTGKRPPDAPSRMVADEIVPARDAALSSYRTTFLAAIDKALALDIGTRPRTVAEWRAMLAAPVPAAEPAPSASAKGAGAPASGKSLAAALAGVEAAPDRHGIVSAPPSPASPVGTHAPTGKGVLEAFMEGWREAAPASAPPARSPPPAPVPAPQPLSRAATPAPAPAQRTPAPAELPRKPPRPARPRMRIRWAQLAIKAAIGVAVAAALISFKERLGQTASRGSQTVTSGAASQAPPSAGQRENR